jgi:hypothetical protein
MRIARIVECCRLSLYFRVRGYIDANKGYPSLQHMCTGCESNNVNKEDPSPQVCDKAHGM